MRENIVEHLWGGCVRCGESDDGAIELYDIEGANELMEDAAEAISALLSIAKRWNALDGCEWDTERYAWTKAALLEDTRKLVVELSGEACSWPKGSGACECYRPGDCDGSCTHPLPYDPVPSPS